MGRHPRPHRRFGSSGHCAPRRVAARYQATLIAALLLGAFACSSSDPAGENTPPSVARGEYRPPAAGARQPDGEVPSTPTARRPPIPEGFKKLLQNHIFWTGGQGLRLELGERYIWLNPTGITPATRYGADVILLSTTAPAYYSPRDIELLNDGNTTVIAPVTVHARRLEGGRLTELPAGQPPFMVRELEVWGVPAYSTPETENGNERWRGHLGYRLRWQTAHLYYTGPIGVVPDLTRYPRADILFAPVSGPGVLRGQALVNFVTKAAPRVFVPVGHDGPGGREALAFLAANVSVPLWFPPPPAPPAQVPKTGASATRAPAS